MLTQSQIDDIAQLLLDAAADNAFAARVVLGGTLTPIEGLDLRLVGVMVESNGSRWPNTPTTR